KVVEYKNTKSCNLILFPRYFMVTYYIKWSQGPVHRGPRVDRSHSASYPVLLYPPQRNRHHKPNDIHGLISEAVLGKHRESNKCLRAVSNKQNATSHYPISSSRKSCVREEIRNPYISIC